MLDRACFTLAPLGCLTSHFFSIEQPVPLLVNGLGYGISRSSSEVHKLA